MATTKDSIILASADHLVCYFETMAAWKKVQPTRFCDNKAPRKGTLTAHVATARLNQKVETQSHQIVVNVDNPNDNMSIVLSSYNCMIFDAFENIFHLE